MSQSAAGTATEVRRRLKDRANELGLEFQQAVLYFAMERFLYRLSRSVWSDRLIVKGAVMLRVWDDSITRPTRDIDFLGRVDNTPEAVQAIVLDCLSMDVGDGLAFASVVDAEAIMVEGRYPGVRAKVTGDLAGARFVLRIDVAVDDEVVPEPGWVEYPTLLPGDAPRILAYQPPTAVAEKLQAMVEIGLSNSRLKDYHDIWTLSRNLEFKGDDLAAALRATFAKRETALPAETPPELTNEYASQASVARMWATYRAGVAKAGVDVPEHLDDLVEGIATFVMPAVRAAADGDVFVMRWTPGEGWR